jgi:hypothetical protein
VTKVNHQRSAKARVFQQTASRVSARRKYRRRHFLGGLDRSGPEALKRVVAYAHRFSPTAVVLGRLLLHDIALPNLIGRSLFEDRPDLIINHQSTDPQRVDASLKKAIDTKDYVSLVDLLCPADKCIVYASKTAPLQFDQSHLTTEGSIFLAKQLKSAGLL